MKPKNETLKYQIINAATDLIIETGIANTSTVKVAKRIHSSQSNLYSYFKNKQALLLAVFDYHQKLMTNSLATIPSADQGVQRQITAITQQLLKFADEHPQSIQLIAAFRTQPNLRSQLPTIAENETLRVLFQTLAQYQSAHIIKDVPAEFLAEGVFALIVNYTTAQLAHETYTVDLKPDAIIQMVVDLVTEH